MMRGSYNYRLSSTRRVVENAFGIMANRFGCLLTTMSQNPETITSIVFACCTLHIIMRLRYPGIHQGIADEEHDNHRVIPGQWRQVACLQDIEEVAGGNRDPQVARSQRLYLKHYCNVNKVSVLVYYNKVMMKLHFTSVLLSRSKRSS